METGQGIAWLQIRHSPKPLCAIFVSSLLLSACASSSSLVAEFDFVIDCGAYEGTWERWGQPRSRVDCKEKLKPIRFESGMIHRIVASTEQAILLKVSRDGKSIRECDDDACDPKLKKTPSVSVTGNTVTFLTKQLTFLRNGYRGALSTENYRFAESISDEEKPRSIKVHLVQGVKIRLSLGSSVTPTNFSIEKRHVRIDPDRGVLMPRVGLTFGLRTIAVRVTPPPGKEKEIWNIENVLDRPRKGIETVHLVKTVGYAWMFEKEGVSSEWYSFIIDNRNCVVPAPGLKLPPPPAGSIRPLAPSLCNPK